MYICVCVYICRYTYMLACIHTYIIIYIHLFIRTYIYTYGDYVLAAAEKHKQKLHVARASVTLLLRRKLVLGEVNYP